MLEIYFFFLQIVKVISLGGIIVSVQQLFNGIEIDGTVGWKHVCVGELLTSESVLTASSCLTHIDESLHVVVIRNEEVRLYCGDKDPDFADQDDKRLIMYVKSVRTHPEYLTIKSGVFEHEFDFAVLFTKRHVRIGHPLKIVPLYSDDVDVVRQRLHKIGSKCLTVTWHYYMEGEIISLKIENMWIDVTLQPTRACRGIRDDKSTKMNQTFAMEDGNNEDFLLCITSTKGFPVCRMDPGAPILCEGKIVAIVTNIGLLCDQGDDSVLASGINNAMAFLTEPTSFFDMRERTRLMDSSSEMLKLSITFIALIRLIINFISMIT